MMNGQKFCLKWDHFRSSVTSVFNNLRQDEELVDITLCCEGQRIKAHRMMLSACSPYFRELLKVGGEQAEMCELCMLHVQKSQTLSICIVPMALRLLPDTWHIVLCTFFHHCSLIITHFHTFRLHFIPKNGHVLKLISFDYLD